MVLLIQLYGIADRESSSSTDTAQPHNYRGQKCVPLQGHTIIIIHTLFVHVFYFYAIL